MKSLWTHFILFCSLTLYSVSGAEAAEKIRFGLSASHTPPMLYIFENQNLPIATGGFLYEISVALADEMKVDYSLVIIPRGRMSQELMSGNIDLLCHSSTAWNSAYQEEVKWSKTLYAFRKVIVSKTEIPFSRIDTMPKVSIGTVEDFVYPDLEKRFKDKTLFRDDAPSVTANVVKLLGDRLDYVVMSELDFPLYKLQYPELKRSRFYIDRLEIRCALSKRSSLSLEKLNAAIDRLKKKSVLQKTFQRYQNPKTLPKPLVYGLNNNDSPPFIFFDNTTEPPTVRGGIFFDLALEVGKYVRRPLVFVLLPRSRLHSDLAEGQVDLICFDTEIWSGELSKKYYWSNPIFRQSDHIVSLKDLTSESNIKTLDDLKGKTLGTTLNFVYPTLAPYFKKGTILREDADSGFANLKKLKLNRVSYIVLNKLEYEYYKKSNPLLQRAPMDIDPIDVKCAISKRSDLKLNRLNEAIFAMKRNGRLEKVFTQ